MQTIPTQTSSNKKTMSPDETVPDPADKRLHPLALREKICSARPSAEFFRCAMEASPHSPSRMLLCTE